ncbi:acetyl-CoA carboxylase, carboxyltransferase subunit beta [Alicyclobacillus tolerans]|uniref:Acetyl-coenzyme A carboxylase carboxyl transferase subunit beta n=2 Tax=Alicyclobacillus tolerans TaxID=90970 RepID=A0A1M6U1U9_9BACL|nr:MULTISPECIES: acetyl-CoA carboxylase, carboxyltransferase subunit beta [Alicyclobacillus]MDP9727947.1 acetyl-CoA carboxylase carboxyl transferase subunit beta [Alicyclobacillus tengchongensis]QRF24244.1 acetyl-CoA carboxylase carboxyltransferase subunit beta [Alicyclobacillus sp. TC]SHK63124.1 acetyl-CoA carboxylase carboxyltransferase subunit alpha [Alicyclobacillus montanus]
MLKDLFVKKRHYATLPSAVKSSERDQKSQSVPEKDIPKGLVEKCDGCGALLLGKELQKHDFTCPHCDYHFTLGADRRIRLTLDEGSFEEWDASLTSVNPLHFPDYDKKLAKAQEMTGMREGVVTGRGTIAGIPLAMGVMDSRFIMGSMGSAVGEKLTRMMERALAERLPVVLFTASGGARMQEGILSLMQMAKTSVALERLHEEQLLFVTVITHPTTGGVSASFASLGDIILAEPRALFGFAGRRVIEQTIRQKLPDDFQTAEFMLKHGMIDEVVHRKELVHTLANILTIHSAKGWKHGNGT